MDHTPETRPDPVRPVPRMARPSRRTHPLLPIGALFGLLLAVMLAFSGTLTNAADAATALLGQAATPTATAQTTASDATDKTVEQVYAAANPAVVTVTTLGQPSQANGRVFGQPNGAIGTTGQDQPLSSGSGFIWDSDGHVITNAHVVAGGDSFTVTFSDGTTVDATLVGADTYADVAVLQVELADGQTLPAVATIGDSASVAAGQTVVAIGSPYGELTNTVSEGIVGATGRSLASSAGTYDLTDLIQHDASIYPGNSGGPLLNLAGEVVGINVATLSDTQTGQTSGIGFALSIDSVRPMITDIIATGSFARPYLGIQSQVTQDGGQGVVAVDPDGPSADTLQAGDLITAVDGTDIGFDTPFLNELFQHQPGDSVDLTIQRDGKSQTVSVTLGERPADPAS